MLTLVPPSAVVGGRFHFTGPNDGPECEGCPVQRLCFGLEPGRSYQITALRDVSHPCGLHADGRARVAEVAEAPIEASIEEKHLRGTAAVWNAPPCGRPECPNNARCHPVGPPQGVRYAIQAVGDRLDCPAGFDLRAARMQRLADAVTGD